MLVFRVNVMLNFYLAGIAGREFRVTYLYTIVNKYEILTHIQLISTTGYSE